MGQPLWVDLKGRQLRVVGAAIPPYSELFLSHPLQVKTPVDAFFSDGREMGRIVAVDGNRIILEGGPRHLIGPGESVNIIDPSLKIEGTLTATDLAYLNAMRERGLKNVMISFAESPTDAEEVRALLPGAEIIQKIESLRGLAYARQTGPRHGCLMAARGDLYVEVIRPHRILSALKDIIHADPNAIVASRILDSLAYQPVPESADLGFLLEIGYQTFMRGDRSA